MKKTKPKKHLEKKHHEKPSPTAAPAAAKRTDLDSVMHPKFQKAIAIAPMAKRKVGTDEARLAYLEKE